jgi:hypothetical protein
LHEAVAAVRAGGTLVVISSIDPSGHYPMPDTRCPMPDARCPMPENIIEVITRRSPADIQRVQTGPGQVDIGRLFVRR